LAEVDDISAEAPHAGDPDVHPPVCEPAGLEAARLDLRAAGYCVVCNRIVVRDADGACPEGHGPAAVSGRILLGPDDAVPELPRFNLAAFLIPPIWGPAHGQWAGAVFLPVWLFADGAIRSAGEGGIALTGALIVALGTVAAQAWFATHANGLAWRRVADTVDVDTFVARQRRWAWASVPVAAALLGWAIWFDLFFAR